MRRGMVLALLLLVLGGVGALVAAPPQELSAFGRGPRDMESFRRVLESVGYSTEAVVTTPLLLHGFSQPRGVVLFEMGVSRPFSPSEIEAIERFVERGGYVIVGDDAGFATALSSRFGVFFDKIPLRDSRFRGNASLVETTLLLDLGTHPRTYTVILDEPTALSVDEKIAPNARILGLSSSDSYLDNDRNFRKDPGDTHGPFPVALFVPRGKGGVVFLSDAGIFTNDLVSLAGSENALFGSDLVGALLERSSSTSGLVLFDESRHSTSPLGSVVSFAASAVVFPTKDPFWRWVTVLSLGVVAFAILLFVPFPSRLGPHRSRLDDPSTVEGDPLPVRLRRLGLEKVRVLHALPEEADPSTIARHAQDPVLGSFLSGSSEDFSDRNLHDILRRIREYRTSRSGEDSWQQGPRT